MITDENYIFGNFKYMRLFWNLSLHFVLSACKNEMYTFYSHPD